MRIIYIDDTLFLQDADLYVAFKLKVEFVVLINMVLINLFAVVFSMLQVYRNLLKDTTRSLRIVFLI